MKYTVTATVLFSLLLAGPVAASAGKERSRSETQPDRREVQQHRRTTRDDAKDLGTLRDIQVELARARVESDPDAVAALDARVMAMLKNGQAKGERKDGVRDRVTAEWAQLEGRYERQDLERRVLLLDELVDVARSEAEENERERGQQRREIRDDRRPGGESDGHERIQPRS